MKNEVFLDGLRIDRASEVSLGEQLRNNLRRAVLEGRIKAGARMPSTRLLAKKLKVGRNTVLNAYETLIAEGYLYSRTGQGTFVSGNIAAAPNAKAETASVEISDRAQMLLSNSDSWQLMNADQVLEPGIPALDAFPLARWKKCWTAVTQGRLRAALNFTDPRGSLGLRQVIANHIGPSRGVVCTPEQIFIFSSMRQVLHLLMLFLLDEGGSVLIEDPGLPETRSVTLAQRLKHMSLPITEGGADIRKVGPAADAARLAIVTASHQYPLGVTLGEEQKQALFEWADMANGYIIEDDYDGEFWMDKPAPQALFAENTSSRVIYVNSFSKTLFPALRISYMVLPPQLVEQVTRLKGLFEPHVSSNTQLALTEFISSGAYNTHLREMRALYVERHNILRHALEQSMGERIKFGPGGFGLHFCVELDDRIDDVTVSKQMQAVGLGPRALSRYYFGSSSTPTNGLVIGYAGWPAPMLLQAARTFDKLCQ